LLTVASEVGIMPEQFWQIKERELMATINGYRRRQVEEWKRTRLMSYMTYATNAKNPQRIEQWMPLEGDPVVKNTNTLAKIKRLNDKAKTLWLT